MNIDGLGSAIIDLLIEEKMVSNPADLYALDYAAFAELPGQGKKSAANLEAAIEASKQNDLARLLCALASLYGPVPTGARKKSDSCQSSPASRCSGRTAMVI